MQSKSGVLEAKYDVVDADRLPVGLTFSKVWRMAIGLRVTAGARQVMELVRLPHERAAESVNQRDRGMVIPADPARIIALHWFDDDQIVFVDAFVTQSMREESQLYIQEVEAQVVLALRPRLPAGKLNALLDAERLMLTIVQSFGLPVTCDDAHAPEPLFCGKWDGKPPRVNRGDASDSSLTVGSFNARARTCDRVWSLSLRKYMDWWHQR